MVITAHKAQSVVVRYTEIVRELSPKSPAAHTFPHVAGASERVGRTRGQVVHKFSRRQVVGSLLVAVSVAAVVPASASVVSHSTSASGGAATPRRLANGVPTAQLRGAKDLGAARSTTQMHLGFVLAPRDPAALADFATAVNTPGNPLYHHFLAKGEFATRFGASPAAIKTVHDFLASKGLHPGPIQDGLTIPVTTSVATASKSLGTPVHSFKLRDGRNAFANTVAPLVTAGVASSLQTVIGLDNVVHETSAIQRAKKQPKLRVRSNTASPRLAPAATVAAPQACPDANNIASAYGAYTFTQLASTYGMGNLYSKNVDRVAPAVGIIELEPFSFNDIAGLAGCYGISTTITTKSYQGGAGSGVGSGEAALDIETVLATAPDSKITIYSAPNQYGYYAYQGMATDNTAKTLTTSWGSCDAAVPASYAQAEATLFQQMAAQGQDLYAAAGDTGSEGCERMNGSTALSPGDPASQPFVTGVGGTRLQDTAPTESVWNDTADNAGAGTGGISSRWAMPSYQTGAGVVNSYSSSSICGASSGLCREEPDISANADPETPYEIVYNGGWSLIGGTSAASPLWAGLMAEVSEACPVGFVNPQLYAMAANPGSTPALHDVTVGNNDYGNLHGGAYPATAGYDQATGLGTPNAIGIAAHLCAPTAPTSVSAAAGNSRATVSFAAPASNASTISQYTVTATDTTSAARGGQTAVGASSPLTVSGLTNGDVYTFDVTATNAWGTGSAGTSTATTPSPALLGSGQQLATGDALHSLDGKDTLVMQVDGNLVEYDANGAALWATGTNPSGTTASMRSDGALVVTDASNAVLWSSGTTGHAGSHLAVVDGGALQIVGSDATPLWQSSGLVSGQTLSPGQSVESPGGGYVLTMQSDGNLVEYDAAGHPVWAAGTNPSGASAVMGSDGALVVKDSGGSVLWSSGTSGNARASASLSASGQLLVSAGTTMLWGPGLLVPGRVLHANDTVASPNGRYVLVMQNDGNLVEYSSGSAVWATGTQPSGATATMTGTGTLAVADAGSTVLWASGAAAGSGGYLTVGNDGVIRTLTSSGTATWATSQLVSGETLPPGQSIVAPGGGYVLVMQSDGNLVEYGASGNALWASNTVSAGVKAVMRPQGSLAVVNAADGDEFSTATDTSPGSVLVLGADGSLTVVDLTGHVVWSRSLT